MAEEVRRHHQRSQYLLPTPSSLHTAAEQQISLVTFQHCVTEREKKGGLKSVEEQSLVQFWTIILGTTITQGTGPPLDPCALHVCVCFDTTATCVWYMYAHVSSTCCAKYATCAHQLSNNNYMFVRPANNQMKTNN